MQWRNVKGSNQHHPATFADWSATLTMGAGFLYQSRTPSASPYDALSYTPITGSKTTQITHPTRLQFPRRSEATYHYETAPSTPRWKYLTPVRVTQEYSPGRQTSDEWINGQSHSTNRSNGERRHQPLDKEELRQRMRHELLYEYEAEAQKWMKHEAELRQKAQERSREEARRKNVQEDITKIQTRVRQRRDSERQMIADERRMRVEREKELQRRERERVYKAVAEVWNNYESRWSGITSSSNTLHFEDIPWPVLVPPKKATDITVDNITTFILHPAHSQTQSRRERIRSALLRWHPDRFRRLLQRVPGREQSAVEEGVCTVTRCLNDLLVAKEGRHGPQVSLAVACTSCGLTRLSRTNDERCVCMMSVLVDRIAVPRSLYPLSLSSLQTFLVAGRCSHGRGRSSLHTRAVL